MFRHNVVVPWTTPAADGTFDTLLPIAPLSHLLLTVACLNNGANTKATLAQILGAVEEVSIIHKGASVLSMNGADLHALVSFLYKSQAWMGNIINTDDATRFITIPIPFGRTPYNVNECFPATSKGDLIFRIKVDIADTGYDGLIYHLESVELPDATPKAYLKATYKTDTPSATGWDDYPLPKGNPYVGILLWGTTVPSGTAWTTTIDQVKLLADNAEVFYQHTYWEALHGNCMLWMPPPAAFAEKIHRENTATAYAQNADTAAEEVVALDLEKYSYMDFSPDGSDTHLFPSGDYGDVKLQIYAGDTNAFRFIPVELVAAAA